MLVDQLVQVSTIYFLRLFIQHHLEQKRNPHPKRFEYNEHGQDYPRSNGVDERLVHQLSVPVAMGHAADYSWCGGTGCAVGRGDRIGKSIAVQVVTLASSCLCRGVPWHLGIGAVVLVLLRLAVVRLALACCSGWHCGACS